MRALRAQLSAGVGDKHADRVFQHIDGFHHGPERAAGDDLLLVRYDLLHIDAGQTVEFALGFFHHHTEPGAQTGHVRESQVLHRVYAVLGQTHAQASAHTPHFVDCDARQQPRLLRSAEVVVIEDTARARVFFSDMVSQLGQRFGRAYADAHRHADPLENGFADAVTQRVQVRHAAQIDKAFVDGIHLGARRKIAEDAHDAVGYVRVQRVVGTQRQNTVLLGQILALEPRLAHAYAQRLGLVRTRHHTAVVVRQHHQRHGFQVWAKQPFAGHIKVVAVHQGQLR